MILVPFNNPMLKIDKRITLEIFAISIETHGIKIAIQIKAIVHRHRATLHTRIFNLALGALINKTQTLVIRKIESDAAKRTFEHCMIVIAMTIRSFV